MNVVLHLYVCLFVSKRMERKLYLYKTPMYFSHFVYFVHIMLYYVVWDQFALVFNSGKDILITYQYSPKSVFYLFTWVQAFIEAWYSLEQYIGLKEDKLSSTTVDLIRSEGNLETKCLYCFRKPKMC